MRCPLSTLVVDRTGLGVRKMTLRSWADEIITICVQQVLLNQVHGKGLELGSFCGGQVLNGLGMVDHGIELEME